MNSFTDLPMLGAGSTTSHLGSDLKNIEIFCNATSKTHKKHNEYTAVSLHGEQKAAKSFIYLFANLVN